MIMPKYGLGSKITLQLLIFQAISILCMYTNKDQKLMGDLYMKREQNIYSLAWTLYLHANCDIKNVLSNSFYINNSMGKNEEVPPNSDENCTNKELNLIILRELKPFKRTYLVAHPYYKFYKKFKRKILQSYKHNFLRRGLHKEHFNFTYDYLQINQLYDIKTFVKIERCVNYSLKKNLCIKRYDQEVLRKRYKRTEISFNDPLFHEQWHLKNKASKEYDINVYGAWESGITGRGVTVCVIDDGLEWRHPDLRDNYNPRGSYDLNADDPDPSPVKNGDKNEHGTRCAGEIAAVANNICGVGVAYRANISGIRVLGERMTDSMEARAFVEGLSVNDIYSCSWGPNDDGKTVDGPHHLAKEALVHGVTYGRNGYGAIYVVASGNGGRNKDNCNYDGYANSIYTVTIGAVDSRGLMPYYAEECATMLAVTPSSGINGKSIVTTDWQGSSKTGCTHHHTGTSAAAPLAAAVIALALEMQPCLSWRDIQYLIAFTSRKIDRKNPDWIVNKAGLHHSHKHGFGLMDATGMVSAAAVWESVPFSTSYRSMIQSVDQEIPSNSSLHLSVSISVPIGTLDRYALTLLEVVQVHITLTHEYRGSLKISLQCPSGTKSTLASPRIRDNSTRGLNYWPLGTVRCWGENPWGSYTLTIEQTRDQEWKGTLVAWQLVLHGSSLTQNQFQSRRNLLNHVLKGEVVHVNRSQLCHVPEVNYPPLLALSDQTIKILVIFSVFIFLMSVYNSLEYILCYNKEKKVFYERLKDLTRTQTLGRLNHPSNSANQRNQTSSLDFNESQALLTSSSSYENGSLLRSSLSNGAISPSLSCEADISSLNGESDDENDTLCSRNTNDTLVPRDTTDFTTTTTELTTDFTDVASEPDIEQGS